MSDYNQYTDQELISLLRKGNHAAYATIYHRYKYKLQSHAYRKLGDFEEVKDVLHDVFVTLWERRESMPDTANLAGYLYTAVRNRIFNILAHKNIAARCLESLQHYIDDGRYSADSRVGERELEAEIEREIEALPTKMREVFVLSRKSALSHKKIAEQLDISEQTVSKQVSNALKILRKKLGLFVIILIASFTAAICYCLPMLIPK